ncbi:DDE-type integrase/transposase/recombinase [Marivirga sp. S37H4]|uniref:DDE-type integrase/transposase/recombinase n=1 Tax=Marivirga aurantiaca TaxID=2802615 RepID=A0A934WZL9_9BACT|nr:Mu transposase C-terminal domain-containing protein [Marivirga aurantiaca]MBK6265696.1 DDE-type integrase/transposase/recombinase [Marivirga aurantiaca]
MEDAIYKGDIILYEETKYEVIDLDGDEVKLIDSSGNSKTIKLSIASGKIINGIEIIESYSEKKLKEAKSRLAIIRPLIGKKGSRKEVEELSNKTGISTATLYRWIKKYKETELMTSLVPEDRSGGKGKSRLNSALDEIIDSNIQKHYLKSQRKSIKQVHLEIQLACRDEGLRPPHYNTVRRRVLALSELETVKHRLGRAAARKKFSPKISSFPDSLFPLSSVQIDHTPLDIIVVDEKYREPIGRPWLTLAIDTYSRMVVGFYIGFESPNAMSVGLCISQAILPKEEYLAQNEIYTLWPCHGKIRCIHMDNAMEFRSKMLEHACLEYQIDINWRPVKVPEYGGMIERLLGTFSKELHQLEGTTFNRYLNRREYDSEKRAVFTYSEIEKWILTYIVEVYHQKLHLGINTSPINKWREGIIGTDEVVGVGYQPVLTDKRKVLLDFMPFEFRTIQDYGVLVDGIYYYSDILRKWINALDVKSGKLRAKKKFKFKRDPRDISVLYFLDPELKEYFPVPYRNTSHPPMTKWELKAIKDELTKRGMQVINEDAIFDAYKRLREIEDRSLKQTKKARRLNEVKNKQKGHKKIINPPTSKMIEVDDDIFQAHESFEDIDDGSSRKQ